MIDQETARLVRKLTPLIVEERPTIAMRALCDLLGVLTGHVLTGLKGDKRDDMLDGTLGMLRRYVYDSYAEYMDRIGWDEEGDEGVDSGAKPGSAAG